MFSHNWRGCGGGDAQCRAICLIRTPTCYIIPCNGAYKYLSVKYVKITNSVVITGHLT